MDLSAESPDKEELIVFDVVAKRESKGHKYDTKIFNLFCRNEDGESRHVIVEGFRPNFYMSYDTFVEHYANILRDRRVLAIEADLSGLSNSERRFWTNEISGSSDEEETDENPLHGPKKISHELSKNHSSTVYDTDVSEPLGNAVTESEDLVRVITKMPGDVGGGRDRKGLRDAIQDEWGAKTWEADIPFERRFLISSGIYRGLRVPDDFDEDGVIRVRYENWDGASRSSGRVQEIEPADVPRYTMDACRSYDGLQGKRGHEVRPRTLTVDIEVATHGGGVPDPVRARNEVTAITAHDSYTDKYKGWFLTSDEWPESPPEGRETVFEEAIEDEINIETDVSVWENETAMLDNFNGWVADRQFDVITGWSSNGFDYPYIVQRSYELDAWEITRWDRTGNPGVWYGENSSNKDTNYKIDGMVQWDMLDAYKKTLFRDISSYTLDSVAQEELDYGKAPIDDIDEAWHHSPVDFVVYNTRDVEAVVEIERKSNLLDLYEHMRDVTGAGLVDCHTNGPMIDTMFLREAYANSVALPTNIEPDVQDFHGAYVEHPVPGIHDNVVYPDLACFTPDHDVVTPDGIRNITDIDVGDIVYSIDPKSLDVEEKPVVDTHEYPDYDGETITIDGTRASFEVTPNHNMLLRQRSSSEYEFVEADDIDTYHKFVNEWDGVDGPGIDFVDITDLLNASEFDVRASYDMHGHAYRSRLPDGCEKKRANYHEGFFFDGETFVENQDTIEEISDDVALCHPDGGGSTFREYQYDGDDFVEFLAWFITEGNVYSPNGVSTKSVKIAQEDEIDRVVGVFDSMWDSYSVDSGGVTVGSEILGTLFEDLCGSGSRNKKIPDMIFEECSLQQKKLFFDTLVLGDGDEYNFYTSSDQLAEDFTRLCVEVGVKPVVTSRNRRDFIEWEIRISDVADGVDPNTEQITRTKTDDGVYCVTVEDNHTLLAGRDGRFQWVGQSLYPHFMWALNISPETLIRSREELEQSQYNERDVFTAYVDKRGFTTIPKGEEASVSRVDTDKYKGILDEEGSLRKPPGMFEPQYDEIYYLKPDVKTGFIRDTIDKLIDLKNEYRGVGTLYSAIKRVTNSIYGVLGDSASMGRGFRLFDPFLAESITLGGRKTIRFTGNEYVRLINKFAVEEDYAPNAQLVGGDTDSVMTSIPQAPDFETALKWSQRASEAFQGDEDNLGLYDKFARDEFDVEPGVDEHRFDVEIESLSSALFFKQDFDADDEVGVKKRYAEHEVWEEDDLWLHPDVGGWSDVTLLDYSEGVLSDMDPFDNLSITGFEHVRSDIAPITADVQERVFTDLLLSPDYEGRIYTYLEDLVTEVQSGDVPLERIGRTKGVSQELDDYGWKDYDELVVDQNYTPTDVDKENGGRYVSTPGPAYRGLKYAIDHIPWQEDTPKPVRIYIDKVRAGEYPEVYTYDSFPGDDRPDPPEVDRPVDAIAVDEPSRLPDKFVPDYDKMMNKEVRDKIQPILRTVGMDWSSVVGKGRQSGLDQFI